MSDVGSMEVVLDYTVLDTSGTVVDARKQFRTVIGRGELMAEVESAIAQKVKQMQTAADTDERALVVPTAVGEFRINILSLTPSPESFTYDSQDVVVLALLQIKSEGNALVKRGMFAEALSSYERGLALMEDQLVRRTQRDVREVVVPLLLNKAHCCLKLGRWAEAITACSQVLAVDEKNIKAFFRRGLARFENRDMAGARSDLHAVLEMEPGNADAVALIKRLPATAAPARVQATNTYNRQIFAEIDIAVKGEFLGTLEFALDSQRVPKTVENFRLIAESNLYSNCVVFKAVRDQFFQAGDYECNDGSGGNCAVNSDREIGGRKFFNDENLDWPQRVGEDACVIGMANYGPNTNGSQFFVTMGTEAMTAIKGKHVVFGKLVRGTEVVEAVNTLASSAVGNWTPTKIVTIQTVRIRSS